MKKKHGLVIGIAALLTAALFIFAGCPGPTDPAGSKDGTPTVAEMNEADFGSGAVITELTVSNLSEFTTAKTTIEGTTGNYVLNITGTVEVGNAGADIHPAANTVVSLRGGGTIHKSSGTDVPLFFLDNSNSKLVLRDATLKGHVGNNNPLVRVYDSTASFDMTGGTITGNTNTHSGGGVEVGNDGTFTMKGGTISGNTVIYDGGGVIVGGGTFYMTGGTISGNTANSGGGVFVGNYSTFTKTGGTIYGKDSGVNTNGADGNNLGYAVYVRDGSKYRSTTVGPTVNLDSGTNANWNQ